MTVDPFCFCLSKSLKFPLAYPMNFFPSIDSNSSLVLSGTAQNFCTVTHQTFLTFSLVLRILAPRRLDLRSFSYFSHPQLRNALGICSCTLELMSIPPNIALPTVCDISHCVGCSFPPRSLPSTFLCVFENVVLGETGAIVQENTEAMVLGELLPWYWEITKP